MGRGVRIAAHDGHPRQGKPLFRSDDMHNALARITHEEGLSVIIVEQHPQAILAISHQAVVLDQGRVIHAGPSEALLNQSALLEQLLGIAQKKG